MASRFALVGLWFIAFTIPAEEFVRISFVGSIVSAVGMLTTAVGLLSMLFERKMRPLTKLHLVVLLFVGWNAMTTFWSVYPEGGLTRVAQFGKLMIMIWLIYQFLDSPDKQKSVMNAYVLGCIFSVINMFYNIYIGDYAGYTDYARAPGRYTGSEMNENDLALVLAIGFFVSYYFATLKTKGQSMQRWFYICSCVIIIVSIFLTGSRGGLVSLLAGVAYHGILATKGSIRKKALYAFLGACVFGLVVYLVPDITISRLEGTEKEVRYGDMTKRLDIWKAGIQIWFENPIVGVGSGAFDVAARKYVDGSSSHNSYLSVLVESGLVGLMIFLAILLYSAWRTRLLPTEQRRLWRSILVTWAVGAFALGWDYKKPTWLIIGLIMVMSGGGEIGARKGREVDPAGNAREGGSNADRAISHAG